MAEHAGAARERQASAFLRVLEDAKECRVLLRVIAGHEEMLLLDGIDATGSSRARHDGHAHGHGLENLVLGSSGDIERRHHCRGPAHVRPYIRHRAGDRDTGSSASFLTLGTGSAPTIDSRQVRPPLPEAGEDVGAEIEHALLVRVVVHAADERRSHRGRKALLPD